MTLPKRLSWNEAFKKHVVNLDEKKPVIITGDMNVAHQEIGIYFLNNINALKFVNYCRYDLILL